MKRSRFFGTALAALCLLASSAFAQVPAPERSITTNTECGAEAIGRTSTDWSVVLKHKDAGLRVNDKGVWETCSMPSTVPKPEPIGCQAVNWTWTDGDMQCTAAANLDIASGGQATLNARTGLTEGVAVLRCTDGALTVVTSSCSRSAYCTRTSYRGTDDGWQTTWSWNGRLKEGGIGIATSGDKRTRPIECSLGALHLR